MARTARANRHQLANDDASASTPAGEAIPPAAPLLPSELQRRAFAEIAELPNQRLLVLDAGGRVVGTATLLLIPSVAGGGRPRAIIDNVVVDRAFRGRGHGARLLQHCIALARAQGVRKLELTTNERRAAAHRFYERLGFRHSHRGYSMLFES
jgi:GNAT superfamily N-acetyltransferase